MRTRGRTDANQGVVVDYLRKLGMSVEVASAVGGGFPDLVVGYRGLTCLVEIKDGSKTASARELTVAQKEWHAQWAGHRCVVTTKEEAAEAVIEHVALAGRV